MTEFSGLGHLFAVSFLFNFSSFMVIPTITDVTMAAVCPGQDECSVAIYLSGFQNAVSEHRSFAHVSLLLHFLHICVREFEQLVCYGAGHWAGSAHGDPRHRESVGQVRPQGADVAAGGRGHLAAV
jgi:hypothetical protein